jgi:hypothetical protein
MRTGTPDEIIAVLAPMKGKVVMTEHRRNAVKWRDGYRVLDIEPDGVRIKGDYGSGRLVPTHDLPYFFEGLRTEGFCQELVHSPGRGVSSHYCCRDVKEDGLCGLHLSARNRAKARQEAWAEENRATRQLSADNRQRAETITRLTGIPCYASTDGVTFQSANAKRLCEYLAEKERTQ